MESPNLGYKPRFKEGYFPVPPTDSLQDIRNEMMLSLQSLGVPIECQHHEVATGGQAEIDIRFVAKAEVRTSPSFMPEAPAFAVQKLLEKTGLTMADMAVVKNHNPFAVNDAIFAKLLEYDWREMNKTGSSLVWGHPQGPTLTRILIEALEEAVDLGGGHVLLFGCAAGDVGIAALLKVS